MLSIRQVISINMETFFEKAFALAGAAPWIGAIALFVLSMLILCVTGVWIIGGLFWAIFSFPLRLIWAIVSGIFGGIASIFTNGKK